MQIHQLKRNTELTTSPRVGRGGKRGKTSGRGHKGQKARAGHKIRPEIRDFIKKLPKLRGRGKNSNKPIFKKPIVINIGAIESTFENSATINPKNLMAKGLVSYQGGNIPKIKILGTGEITKKFVFEEVLVSKKAKEKLEKSGSTFK
jgi:large subunit ribosomal protein L15